MSINPGSQIVIDLEDPRIRKEGDWFVWQDVGELGRRGPPMLNTLHGFQSRGSLSFEFYGREVWVLGAWTPPERGSVRVNWQCLIDGAVVSNNAVNVSQQSDLSNRTDILCYQGGLSEGNHTIQAVFSSGSGYIWVDVVEYRAPPTADTRDEWSIVSHLGEGIQYSSGWDQDSGRYVTWTYINGASLTYDFTGTGLTWGGYIPRGNSATAQGLGYYTIDGKQPPTHFAIPIHFESRVNQAYINISGLEPGSHCLEVVNNGNAGTAALGFGYIYTKNSSGTVKKSGKVIGAAVGASLGVVLLIGILAIFFILRRRRRLQGAVKVDETEGEIRATGANTGTETRHDPVGRTAYPGQSIVRGG